MALCKIRKLHGLLGLLATMSALPVACGDKFEGCEASRTCPPPNDAGEGGENGNTGGTSPSGGNTSGGTESGGTSGSSGTSGSGGLAGSDDGGAGAGGGSGDTEPPTVVSFTPSDGDSEIERDVTLTIVMSEAIDPSTVTSTSVMLEGPNGRVPGFVHVEGNTISFAPDAPLILLATYTVTLSDAIADQAGNTLVKTQDARFGVRDGKMSELTYPFGSTTSRLATRLQSNAFGDAVVGMDLRPGLTNVHASTYVAEDQRWTPATSLPGAHGYTLSVALDASGRAAVAWGTTTTSFGWSRLTDDSQWVPAGALPFWPSMAATSSGRTFALTSDTMGLQSQTLDLSDGTVGSVDLVPFADLGSCADPVAARERVALICTRSLSSEQELIALWNIGSTWGPPERIASGVDFPSFRAGSDEQGNIVVVWREADEIRSRSYEYASGDWTPNQLLATTSTIADVRELDITAGHAIVGVNSFEPTEGLWVMVYEPGSGWLETSKVRLDDPGTNGYNITVSIDASGNGLAVWHSELRHRRYRANEGWQPVDNLGTNVEEYFLFAAGAPDGSVLVVANDLSQNPNGVPLAVRFE
ncbi:MAG TPA: Ig-like domain-containing protein [Polyangiaceae bacterium]